MNAPSRLVVTAADLTRRFGQLRQAPGREPVFITHHGRETHVLLTLSEFKQMQSDARSGRNQGRGERPAMEELAGWIGLPVITLDDAMTIVFANSAAHILVGQADHDLMGRPLFDAIRELEGSTAQGYILRAISARESCSAELPSLFRENGWMRLEVFPSTGSTTIIMRDITDDVQRNRLADAKQAILEAMNVHGEIGYIRLNVRGRIERVDRAVCTMLKLPEDRILHVRMTDIVPISRRVEFQEHLENVLVRGEPVRFETEFLANDGTLIPVCGALTELKGMYGTEGAALIVTRV